ncbi:PspC domain-containing protein [Sphingomonas sp. LY54]|uniref:PspC domain-containing protein n=1 Tax=Sphingomonas sp. LY54 TaxID=3095343 RepID=UPI002D775D9F|nr:PspC domain-containing protein [Sphingomonas sp. LY54]WRP27306.1 PspC domain-containing protein [Sphingomonas sp. LY54]
MNSRYALDKSNAKMLGVCAGLARWMDVDPLLVRVTMVLLTVFVSPVAIPAYLLTALVADNG